MTKEELIQNECKWQILAKEIDNIHPVEFLKIFYKGKVFPSDTKLLKMLAYRQQLSHGAINALVLWSLYKDEGMLNQAYLEKIAAYVNRKCNSDNITAYQVLNSLKISEYSEQQLMNYFLNNYQFD